MRKEKNHRKFHQYVSQTGPSTIRKDTVEFDSCQLYPIRRSFSYDQTAQSWREGLKGYDNSAVFREDPFGINDYAVSFSLNKKKRWEINEEIAERIEEVQDPGKKLRVSASVHPQDVSKCGYFFYGTPRDLECSEYHSVTRDGVVSHKSTTARTRLGNFTHPDGRPPRNGPRSSRYREKDNWHEDSDFPPEEGEQFQKVHVHYTTHLLTDRPSMHNKISHRSRSCSYFPYPKEFKYAKNPVVVDDGDDCKKFDSAREKDDNDEEEFVVVDRSTIPTIVDDLSKLVVDKKNNRKKNKWVAI